MSYTFCDIMLSIRNEESCCLRIMHNECKLDKVLVNRRANDYFDVFNSLLFLIELKHRTNVYHIVLMIRQNIVRWPIREYIACKHYYVQL